MAYLDFVSFDEVFRTLLVWEGLGFIFHIHGRELTSFLRRTRVLRKALLEMRTLTCADAAAGSCQAGLCRTAEHSLRMGRSVGHFFSYKSALTYGSLWPSRWRGLSLGVPQCMMVFSAISIGFKL
jgi:hypothetical protein